MTPAPDTTSSFSRERKLPVSSAQPTSTRPRKSLLWQVGQMLCRIWTTRYFQLQIFGQRNIPPTGGVLFVSNHQSYLDPILLAVQLRRPMSYMARATLFKNRFFSWLISNLNAFPVRRGEGDVGAVKETIRRLDEGHMLALFPEGTRSIDGEMKALEPGVALIIRRTTAAVVPAVIDGSYEAWPKGRKLPHAHPVRVLYGPPLDIKGLKGNQIVPLLEKTLKQMLADLRSGNMRKYQ